MSHKGSMKSPWLLHAERVARKVVIKADSYQSLTQSELQAKTDVLCKDVQSAKNEKKWMDSHLVEAFALVYEVSKRTTGLTPFEVQIVGGIALHEGHIAEAKTGEGKTLMAAMPSFLHALSKKGVHVVTVNPYLAKRDADNIGRIHEYLGLTVGCVTPDLSPIQRKEEYAKDIIYISNSELGFDYLRDNMALSQNNVVQRSQNYAIVDEIDSILIDEAKTPLIIAGQGKDVSKLCVAVDKVVSKMQEGSETRAFNKSEAYLGVERQETGDYIVHEKDQNVVLTDAGVKKIEQAFNLTNYADESNRQIQHAVERSLRAHCLMKKNKHYIVRKGQVLIVDDFTGRVQEGRQYSDGLHQAIEAKEHVKISEANQTIGTTTYQNFFRKYKLLCGMTGTAATERKEFKSTYGLKVKVIPTNKPMIRIDEEDHLYLRADAKHLAAMNRICTERAKGRPILIGTASVEESETMHLLLKKNKIPHQVLNAKQDEKEASIIAHAGIHGTVTVATNMAGRGTDIILDDIAREAGGLIVIGTEKNEAARIDNQLRGRAGRQGDPGTSVFYVSAEDKNMRLYGSDAFRKKLENTDFDNNEEIPVKAVMRSIRSTQHKVELNNLAVRRDTLAYDDVNDMQREQIYAERRRILAKQDVSAQFRQMFTAFAKDFVEQTPKAEVAEQLKEFANLELQQHDNPKKRQSKKQLMKQVAATLTQAADELTTKMEPKASRSYERECLLRAIDTAWAEQLKALEFARDAVSYSGYGQRDPKAVYAEKAYELYEKMMKNVRAFTVAIFFANANENISANTNDGSIKIKKNKGMEV